MSHVAGEKPYSCKFEGCDRAFAQLSNLQHHMRNHEDQVKKEASRVHKCLVCHRSYTNESSLKAHTLKVSIRIVYCVAMATRRNSKGSVFAGSSDLNFPQGTTTTTTTTTTKKGKQAACCNAAYWCWPWMSQPSIITVCVSCRQFHLSWDS